MTSSHQVSAGLAAWLAQTNFTLEEVCNAGVEQAPDAYRCEVAPVCETDDYIIPYMKWWCVKQPALAFFLLVAMALWMGTLFTTLSHLAEHYLSPAMTHISSSLHVPPRLAGVTLLSWANGAPDLSANIAAMRSGKVYLALGSALGAAMFIVCLLGGLLIHLAGGMAVKGAMVRDVVVYVMALAFMLCMLDASKVTASYIAVCMLAYMCYVLSVLMADFHHRGWLPYQRTSSALSATAAASAAAAAAPDTPSKRGRGAARALGVLTRAGHKVQHGLKRIRLNGTSVAHKPRSPRRGLRPSPTAARSVELSTLSSFSSGDAMLLNDNLPLSSSARHGVGTPHVTTNSIQNVTSPAVSAWQRVGEKVLFFVSQAFQLMATPLKLLQSISTPSLHLPEVGSASDVAVSALLARTALASQVIALYWRDDLTVSGWVWLTGIWQATVTVPLGLLAWYCRSSELSSFAEVSAEIQMGPLAHCDANEQMLAIEEQRLSPTAGRSLPLFDDDVPIERSVSRQISISERGLHSSVRASGPAAESAQAASLSHDAAGVSGTIPEHSAIYQTDRRGSGHADAAESQQHTLQAMTGSSFQSDFSGDVTAGWIGSARAWIIFLVACHMLSFGVAVVWIQVVAEELVALLDFVGEVLGMDHVLLGMTLLAWGNCSADVAATAAIAKTKVAIAMTAVYAGPLMDLLIALPVGFWSQLAASGSRSISVDLPLPVAIAGVMLILHTMTMLFVAWCYNGFVPAWFARVSWLAYIVYFSITIAVSVL